MEIKRCQNQNIGFGANVSITGSFNFKQAKQLRPLAELLETMGDDSFKHNINCTSGGKIILETYRSLAGNNAGIMMLVKASRSSKNLGVLMQLARDRIKPCVDAIQNLSRK